MITFNNKRWALVNKNTGNTRVSKTTRDEARMSKRTTERILDTRTGMFVR